MGRACLAGALAALALVSAVSADETSYAEVAVFNMNITLSPGSVPSGVEITMHRAWSPHGFDRFAELVDAGFYDDTRFFRVVPGFIVQWGIAADPGMDAVWTSKKIPDDVDVPADVLQSNRRGTVTFAKQTSSDTRTTQLFINFVDNAFLDTQGFTPLGEISEEDMAVVDQIYSVYAQQPRQDKAHDLGNAYLNGTFPNLSFISSLTCESGCPGEVAAEGEEADGPSAAPPLPPPPEGGDGGDGGDGGWKPVLLTTFIVCAGVLGAWQLFRVCRKRQAAHEDSTPLVAQA